MGCLKLTYRTTETPLKVVYRKSSFEQNIAQRFLRVDPLAEKFPGWSPYTYVFNNPVRFTDPTGMEGVDGVTDPPTKEQQAAMAKADKDYGAASEKYAVRADRIESTVVTTSDKQVGGNSEQSAQNGGYENQYGTRPRNVEGFVDRFDGMTYDEIMQGNSSFLGIKYPNRLADARYGFVRDPQSPGTGRQVDMIHFMVVGQKGVMMGLANELQQLGQGIFGNDHAMESAFHPQDLYSNRLGAEFFQSYGTLIEQNPTKIAQYIGQFLNDPGRNRYKSIFK